jgi:GTP-binding protein
MLKQISFLQSVYDLSKIPRQARPQLILCGRSNVGKSTFINSLFNKKQLAKTSSTPGKTRSINFYDVDNKFFIVDLPGFGYAKTSKKEREKWGSLVSSYIKNTDQIHHAFHLVDSRYQPTELDINLNQWLHYAQIDFSVLLNKVDKLSQADFVKTDKTVRKIFPELELNKNLFYYSSVKGKWKKSIQKKILDLFY